MCGPEKLLLKSNRFCKQNKNQQSNSCRIYESVKSETPVSLNVDRESFVHSFIHSFVRSLVRSFNTLGAIERRDLFKIPFGHCRLRAFAFLAFQIRQRCQNVDLINFLFRFVFLASFKYWINIWTHLVHVICASI